MKYVEQLSNIPLPGPNHTLLFSTVTDLINATNPIITHTNTWHHRKWERIVSTFKIYGSPSKCKSMYCLAENRVKNMRVLVDAPRIPPIPLIPKRICLTTPDEQLCINLRMRLISGVNPRTIYTAVLRYASQATIVS